MNVWYTASVLHHRHLAWHDRKLKEAQAKKALERKSRKVKVNENEVGEKTNNLLLANQIVNDIVLSVTERGNWYFQLLSWKCCPILCSMSQCGKLVPRLFHLMEWKCIIHAQCTYPKIVYWHWCSNNVITLDTWQILMYTSYATQVSFTSVIPVVLYLSQKFCP